MWVWDFGPFPVHKTSQLRKHSQFQEPGILACCFWRRLGGGLHFVTSKSARLLVGSWGASDRADFDTVALTASVTRADWNAHSAVCGLCSMQEQLSRPPRLRLLDRSLPREKT